MFGAGEVKLVTTLDMKQGAVGKELRSKREIFDQCEGTSPKFWEEGGWGN